MTVEAVEFVAVDPDWSNVPMPEWFREHGELYTGIALGVAMVAVVVVAVIMRMISGKRFGWAALIVAIVFLESILGIALWAVLSVPEDGETEPVAETTRLIRVIDGDTIAVEPTEDLPATNDAGDEHHVRLLGIDAPEMHHGDDADRECGAAAATGHLEQLLPVGADVTLVFDSRADATDRYGRSLAYVGSADVDDAARDLVTSGYASAWYPGSEREPERYGEYVDATETARADGAGAWGECGEIGR